MENNGANSIYGIMKLSLSKGGDFGAEREKVVFDEAKFWKNEAKMLKQGAIDVVEEELI
ncbi:hypothetical protein COLO4_20744 [Corchorus olitorius]|uniref:Uncharacterized protein n=1 Tax=Corchorus olitorius TaxID=93759 RepID=A0A1R3IX84_9ROSI|nr:hypothetical protein COLO4_20744 [Corchorus olitorius]